MRWPYKIKTDIDKIKKRFALIPRVLGDEWVWLESYYSFSWIDRDGHGAIAFDTYAEAVDWVKEWEKDQ